jgi:hypothetical protein
MTTSGRAVTQQKVKSPLVHSGVSRHLVRPSP